MALLLVVMFSFSTAHAKSAAAQENVATRIPLSEILSSNTPFLTYVRAWNAFEFHSSSISTIGASENKITLKGETYIKNTDSGDIELNRQPMFESPRLIYRFVKGRAYLKKKEEGPFLRVREQKEFERWLNVGISEVLSLFKKAGFDDSGQGSIKDKSLCWTKPAGTLCVDSATGLPSTGQLTVSETGAPPIQIEFKAMPRANGTLSVDAP